MKPYIRILIELAGGIIGGYLVGMAIMLIVASNSGGISLDAVLVYLYIANALSALIIILILNYSLGGKNRIIHAIAASLVGAAIGEIGLLLGLLENNILLKAPIASYALIIIVWSLPAVLTTIAINWKWNR